MNSMKEPNTGVKPAEPEQLRRLRGQGWSPGVPPQVQEWAQKIDRGACRRARCPECHITGLTYRPFRQGARYPVVGVCPRAGCGFAEEF